MIVWQRILSEAPVSRSLIDLLPKKGSVRRLHSNQSGDVDNVTSLTSPFTRTIYGLQVWGNPPFSGEGRMRQQFTTPRVYFTKAVKILILVLVPAISTSSCDICELFGPCKDAAVPVGDEVLNVPAALQQTPVWCWVTTGEMVFRYYNVPPINQSSYQCGIIALMHPVCAQSCLNCQVGASSIEMIANMIRQYPIYAQQITGIPTRHLTAEVKYRSLSTEEVAAELEAKRPIIVAINTSGRYTGPFISEHVAVIAGYQADGVQMSLLVNDPFPYDIGVLYGLGDPYLAAGARKVGPGQYWIDYRDFKSHLVWGQTILSID